MRKLVKTMKTGLNFASQLTMTAVKPRLAEMVVVMVVVGAGHEQEAREAAERAGYEHGAHYDALDLYADVAGRALALADDAYLIAVLGVLEVDVHEHGEDCDYQHVEHIAVAAEHGQPAGLALLVDDADLAAAGGLSQIMMKKATSCMAT